MDLRAPDESDLAAAQKAAISDSLPLVIPAFPFAFVLGLAISESPIPNGIGWLTSPVMFAGAAQFAFITLVGSASIWAAVAASIVINARHVMYSAALAPTFKNQPMWFRLIGPYTLVDQVFALSLARQDDHPTMFRRYYLAMSAIFSVGWLAATTAGLTLGSFLPEEWQLGYAPAVMFVGLVVMSLTRKPAAVSAVVGALVCFVALGLPNRTGLLVGAVCGVLAGVWTEQRLGTDKE